MTARPARSPGLIIAAPRSGSGKTTVTLGLLRALRRSGLGAQPAKCGPDYIDPGFHEAASGRTSFNLDAWAMRPALIDFLIDHLSADADIVICEALMGLFDGMSMKSGDGDGSSAGIAALSGWPVVLVIDVTGQSESVAALVKGFAGFDPKVRIGGVILNRIGSERHRRLCAEAMKAAGLKPPGIIAIGAMVGLRRHLEQALIRLTAAPLMTAGQAEEISDMLSLP